MVYLIGSVFIAFFVWAAFRLLYLRYRGIATTGTIVALESIKDGDGDTYKPVVAFTTQQGQRIEAMSMYGTSEAGTYFKVGEKVRLRYAPRKPTCFAIEGYEVSAVLLLFFFAAAGGVFIWLTFSS